LPKKKDRVVTLRINEEDFKVVDSFAKSKGLSVSAYINSVIKSQTEFFIPLASNEKVSIPKKALYSLFSFASKDSLDDLVAQWAIELKHTVQLIWGELNLQTSLDAIFKISKYVMGTDVRVITSSNITNVTSYNEMKELGTIINYNDGVSGINTSNTFWIVIRHNLGVNYSYFLNKMFIQFLELLQDSVDVMTEYDETTISIRLRVKRD
jgi:hypothetical protein